MKDKIFLISILIFIGCRQQPVVGDWYRQKGSLERIKIIFVGKGALANQYCEKRTAEMWANVPQEKLARAGYIINYSESDSMKDCVVWNESTNPFHPRYVICPEEDFIDYELIK